MSERDLRITLEIKPKEEPSPAAKKIYVRNAVLFAIVMILLTIWVNSHWETFSGKAVVGTVTIWAILKVIASWVRKLGPDDDAQRAWLAKPGTTENLIVLGVAALVIILATSSLYVRNDKSDSGNVIIDVQNPSLGLLALDASQSTDGRPFFSGFQLHTSTLTVKQPKGYLPKTVRLWPGWSTMLRYPGNFDPIPVVRLLPDRALSDTIPRPQDAPQNITLRICAGGAHAERSHFYFRPVYFGAHDLEVEKNAEARGKGNAYDDFLLRHVIERGATTDAVQKEHIATYKTTPLYIPFDRDLKPKEPVIVVIERVIERVTTPIACVEIKPYGELTTQLIKENQCSQVQLQQCSSRQRP